MSGSPPEERSEPQQLAGQRRKRSDTPPATTAAAVAQPVPAPAQFEQATQRHGGYSGQDPGSGGPRSFPASNSGTYPASQAFGYGTGVASVAASSTSAPLHFGPGQISPRATRKVKAHVASACVNCKKKHLRCDLARPCNRCVTTGKESTCFDVEHKKRGRPPLKPEDSASRRSYEAAALSPLPGPSLEPSRRMPQAGPSGYFPLPPTFQRDIRPTQTSGLHDYGRSILRPGPPPQSIYAHPTISQSPATAMGTMIPSARPFSGEVSSASTQSSNPYIISPSGYSPYGVENVPRSLAPYGSNYPYPQQQGSMLPPSQSLYSYPTFPRDSPQSMRPAENPVGLYGTSSLQLPPIRPAPQGSFEPAMAQQQRQAQNLLQQQQRHTQEEQQGSDDGTRQPDPKRPRMDIKGILGPRND